MTDAEYWTKLYEIAVQSMRTNQGFAQETRHQAIIATAEGLDEHLQGKLVGPCDPQHVEPDEVRG